MNCWHDIFLPMFCKAKKQLMKLVESFDFISVFQRTVLYLVLKPGLVPRAQRASDLIGCWALCLFAHANIQMFQMASFLMVEIRYLKIASPALAGVVLGAGSVSPNSRQALHLVK